MRNVWIIGAGISGLSIKEFLGKSNYLVKLIEKNNYLGGRIKSIKVNSSTIDVGSQFFCKSDRHIWKLIERRNLEDKVIRLDFSDISFLCGKELYQDTDTIRSLINDILERYKLYDGKNGHVSFDEWFLSNFSKDEIFIPKSIINAITFTDTSKLTVDYGVYILETFFDECFSLEGGLKELIQPISENATVEMKKVESIIFKGNKAVRLLTNKDKIDVENDLVISTAPPSTVKIVGNEKLENILSKIRFRGCAVTIFKTKKYFEDKPNYIFIQKGKSPISVIEQINMGNDTFVGCLIPHSESISISKQKAVKLCVNFLKRVIDEDFKDSVEEVFYEDWIKGLPIVDVTYNKYLGKLREEMKFRNFILAGDHTTPFPSMDSAVKSAIEACTEIENLR